MPKLQVTLPDGSQRDHELTEQVVTIGRAQDNVLHIDDASISSHHAQISPSPDGYVLKDLDSTNGTRVNGNHLEPNTDCTLKAGDKIRFGKLEGVFDPERAEEGAPELPADEERVVAAAATSVKPSNFMNASPFQKRQVKKNPVSTASMVIGGASIVASVLLILVLFLM